MNLASLSEITNYRVINQSFLEKMYILPMLLLPELDTNVENKHVTIRTPHQAMIAY